MSKALRHMPKPEREAAIRRRIESKTMGLGYWAAVEAQRKEQAKAAQKQ